MPIPLTYPGVYIEEIPSEVRTITGVATSITAFIGRAVRGPTDTDSPIIVTSLADFNRVFGGLGRDFPMSYSVRDFFQNGGSQAVIVRLFRQPSGQDDGITRFTFGDDDDDGFQLRAAYPGAWGQQLAVQVELTPNADVAGRLGVQASELFKLTVIDSNPGGRTEQILNLTVVDSVRRIDKVLAAESSLLRWDGDDLSSTTPSVTTGAAEPEGGSDGLPLQDVHYVGDADKKTGIHALDKTDIFNLLCIPPDVRTGNTSNPVWQAALNYCVDRRAMLIVDSPAEWSADPLPTKAAKDGLSALGLVGLAARNAALYFPRVLESDLLSEGQIDRFVPCGLVAGAFARMDTQRGVWKAPAGLDATLNGTQGLDANLTDPENGLLNPIGINVLRSFPLTGRVIWGARTLRGSDQLADEYKYVPVRRLTLFIEESLFRGTKFVVFEPNDEPLWAVIRLNVGAFMNNLFRQGAFQGQTPRDAYFVRCDKETTTQNDINLGIVNIIVGFAPLKPAEFVVIKIQQIAGQVQT